MPRVASKFRRCMSDEDGPTAAEYAVMAGFLIMVLIAVITAFGHGVSANFSTASQSAFS